VLKNFRDIYKYFVLQIALIFILLFGSVYLLLGSTVSSNLAWYILGGIFLVAYIIVVKLINSIQTKLEEDIYSIRSYLEKIDAKEYDANIKILHYLDFLQISLLLKNLVKRVNNKDKKRTKN